MDKNTENIIDVVTVDEKKNKTKKNIIKVVSIFSASAIGLCALGGVVLYNIVKSNINYKIQDLHICIFPLKESSIVMMFIDSNNKRYRNFYKKFNKLSHDDKLELVNYLIFLYSEDVFISKNIP